MQILSSNTVNSVLLKKFQAHTTNCREYNCSAGINDILPLNQNDLIATGFNDGAIKIWKYLPQSPYIRLHRQLSGHNASVDSLLLFNTSVFLSSSEDGTVKFWNVETGDCIITLNVSPGDEHRTIFGLTALPDGRLVTVDSSIVYTSVNPTSNIKIWNLEDSSSHLIATLPTVIFYTELVGNGKYLAVSTFENCETCDTTSNVDHDKGSIYLYLIEDPKKFFVLGDTGLPNDQDLSEYPGYIHTSSVLDLKSISDNLFASGSVDNTIKVWNLTAIFNDITSGAPLPLKCQFGPVVALDYDKEAQHLISGSFDGLISIYSMEQETAQYGHLLASYNSGMEVNYLKIVNINANDGLN